ncbi:hypothetical protein [Lysobacter sp. Root690]|uniref:hypothetical protein n=1 Tax=Lysobacter sp. Root690 TaxID=1736588 RepID=UPI0012FC96BA|nr:hypothetical protein [Lysobacter sp. Root690]
MVLANKVKICGIGALMVCFAMPAIGAHAACDQQKLITQLKSEDGSWVPVSRKGAMSQLKGGASFYPLMGVKIYEGRVYASTYNLDYSLVTTKPVKTGVLVEGARFLFAPPHVKGDGITDAIRFYSAPKVNYVLTYGSSCGVESNALHLKIYYRGYQADRKEDEVVVFKKRDG